MKNISKQVIKLVTLLVLLLFVSCQKETLTNQELEQDFKIQNSTTKIVSANDIPEVMSFIASKSSDYKFLLDDSTTEEGMNRSHEDNLIMTELITDEITQVTNAYQKSNYTFKLIKQSDLDGKYFLNLVVKEYMDTFYLYIVKYVPDTLWLSNHSIIKDFGDFTGMIYYYSDEGIYIAKVTMQNGSSTSSEKHPCNDPEDNDDYPDDGDGNGGGGGNGVGECSWDFVWSECGEINSSIPHSPAECGIGVGSFYTLSIDCAGDKSMNEFLRHPCEGSGSGGATGGGNSYCQPDPDCVFPMQLNENCDCVESEEIENGDVGVVAPNYGKDINICLGNTFTVDEINTLNENSAIEQLYDYVFDDFGNCNPENPEFAELAAEALLEGGEVDFDDNVILSSEFTNNEKIKCVYDKLAGDGSNLFKDTIGTFINNPSVNLIFTIGNCVSTDVACTQDEYLEETGIITVTIEDVGLNPIELAQTILHEAIHAEIAKYVSEFQSGVDPNNRTYLFQLYAYYKDWADTIDPDFNWDNAADHQAMITNYVNKIASTLRQFDNNRYSIDYYKDYAWDGLRDNYNYTGTLSDSDAAYYASLRPVTNTGIEVCN